MRLRFKIVPDAEPSSPGEWQTFEVPTDTVPQVWSEAARLVCDRLPDGYHFVAYEKEAA